MNEMGIHVTRMGDMRGAHGILVVEKRRLGRHVGGKIKLE
jgi:hypothetical protein